MRRTTTLPVIAWPAFKSRAQNPYHFLLYRAMQQAGVEVREFSWFGAFARRSGIFHMHWPEMVANSGSLTYCSAKLALFAVLLAWLKLRQTRIVWTVHNLRPHEQRHPRLQVALRGILLPALDAYISLSEAAQAEALRLYPRLGRVRAFVIPHGHYRGEYPDELSREQARDRLGIPAAACVYVCLGLIKRYKNIPQLVKTFRQLPDPMARLVVAGMCNERGLWDEICRSADDDSRVILQQGYVRPDTVQVFLRAADVVVQGYKDILNSGSALLALSFGVPVVVPRRGSMQELEQFFGSCWVVAYDSDISAEALEAARSRARRLTAQDRINLDLKLAQVSWESIAAATIDAYKAVYPGRSRVGAS